MKEAAIGMARRELLETLGKDRLKELHRQNRVLDFAALGGVLGVFALLAFCLANLELGVVWVACLVIQGFVLMIFGLVNHDLFVHRRVLHKRIAYPLSLILTVPIHLSATRYHFGHLAHHRHLGGDGDSELFKIDIDSPWKRLLYATFIGVKLASGRIFAKRGRRIQPPIIAPSMEEPRKKIQSEYRMINAVFVGALALGLIWPSYFFFGYLLPLLLITPAANTIRTVLEHSEYDPDNPLKIGCFYRTGVVTRLLFFWDSGDCHVVHHLFPGIPYYHIGPALTDMRPILLARGVEERRSLPALLWVWFTKGYPYRSPRPRVDQPALQG